MKMIRKQMTLEQFNKLKPVVFTNLFNEKTYTHYRLVRTGKVFYTLAFLHNNNEVLVMTRRGTAKTLDGKLIPLKGRY